MIGSRQRLISIFLGLVVFGLSCAFSARAGVVLDVVTVTPAPVHLGPAPTYKQSATLDAGVRAKMLGCVANFSWCRISFDKKTGWVEGVLLRDQRAEFNAHALPHYGKRLGLPIIRREVTPRRSRYRRRQHDERSKLQGRLLKLRSESLTRMKNYQARDLEERQVRQAQDALARQARRAAARAARERLRRRQNQIIEERRYRGLSIAR